MKKICISLCFLLIAVSACKKDNNSFFSKITGKWTIQKTVYTDFDANGKVIGRSELGFNASDFMLFNKDGNGQSIISNGTHFEPQIIRFTYKVDQSTLSVNYDYDSDVTNYQISFVSGNQVILTRETGPLDQLVANERSEMYLKR